MIKTNVQGTRNIMQASLDAGVERVVYTSSVATFGFRSDGKPGDESLSLKPEDAIGTYKRSKIFCRAIGPLPNREAGPACCDRKPHYTCWTQRYPAHADRAYHFRDSARPNAGICRNGPQPCACRRCGNGPFASDPARKKGERYILGGQM